MVRHLYKVANTPVRSAACWAGNLMMCHNFSDFPSDIATLFLAAGVSLTIVDGSGSRTVAMADFLSLDMQAKVIVAAQIPVATPGQVFSSHKVRQRWLESPVMMALLHNHFSSFCLLR